MLSDYVVFEDTEDDPFVEQTQRSKKVQKKKPTVKTHQTSRFSGGTSPTDTTE